MPRIASMLDLSTTSAIRLREGPNGRFTNRPYGGLAWIMAMENQIV